MTREFNRLIQTNPVAFIDIPEAAQVSQGTYTSIIPTCTCMCIFSLNFRHLPVKKLLKKTPEK